MRKNLTDKEIQGIKNLLYQQGKDYVKSHLVLGQRLLTDAELPKFAKKEGFTFPESFIEGYKFY